MIGWELLVKYEAREIAYMQECASWSLQELQAEWTQRVYGAADDRNSVSNGMISDCCFHCYLHTWEHVNDLKCLFAPTTFERFGAKRLEIILSEFQARKAAGP